MTRFRATTCTGWGIRPRSGGSAGGRESSFSSQVIDTAVNCTLVAEFIPHGGKGTNSAWCHHKAEVVADHLNQWDETGNPEHLTQAQLCALDAVSTGKVGTCRGCGGPLDVRDPACKSCRSRHNKRMRRVPGTPPKIGRDSYGRFVSTDAYGAVIE